jgi:hypothetical protein
VKTLPLHFAGLLHLAQLVLLLHHLSHLGSGATRATDCSRVLLASVVLAVACLSQEALLDHLLVVIQLSSGIIHILIAHVSDAIVGRRLLLVINLMQ